MFAFYILVGYVVDPGCIVVMVMLDLTATFDTIDHAILLSRLTHRYGVTGSGSRLTCPVPNACAVWRAARLCARPLLFTAYISLLGDIINKFSLDYHLYIMLVESIE